MVQSKRRVQGKRGVGYKEGKGYKGVRGIRMVRGIRRVRGRGLHHGINDGTGLQVQTAKGNSGKPGKPA